jgi:hypothetical protein
MNDDLEFIACTPPLPEIAGFNTGAKIPYECTIEHIRLAMNDFVEFLGFVNQQLREKGISRLEAMIMPANFSSIVGEFIAMTLPQYCTTLVRNRYHNGHPDLIPADRFAGNAVQHSSEGIEVKASRYFRGWQGHNPENIWLLVFVFESNRPRDAFQDLKPIPFRFMQVFGAQLTKKDWQFAGRSATSRRTITASVTSSGYEKLTANQIYQVPDLSQRE